MQEFNRTFRKSYNAYAAYTEQEAEWGKNYGVKIQKDTLQEKIQNYQKQMHQPSERILRQNDRGAG